MNNTSTNSRKLKIAKCDMKKSAKKANAVSAKKSRGKKSTKLANPITSLANRLASVFEGDPDIVTKFSFDKRLLSVVCYDEDLAADLARICNTHYDLGNLWLDVEFCYVVGKTARNGKAKTKKVSVDGKETNPTKFAELFRNGFELSDSYGGVMQQTDFFGQKWWYLLGSKRVCQYDNDDACNPWGKTTVIPEAVFADLLAIPRFVKLSTIVNDPN